MASASDALQPNTPDEADQGTSLWHALHDAELLSVVSDPLARYVRFEFDIQHLRHFEQLHPDVRWHIVVDGASVLVAREWQAWPGPCPSRSGLIREEQSRIVAEYQSKGRTVSIGWDDFERIVARHPLDIADARVKPRNRASTALLGYGHERGDHLCEFEVVGEAIRCERSDAGEIPLQDLLRLGERYWEAFAAGRPSTDTG